LALSAAKDEPVFNVASPPLPDGDPPPPLGPLLPFWHDAEVREILAVRHDLVFVDRGGRLAPTQVRFAGPDHFFEFVIQLASHTGREISLATPVTDCRIGRARLTLTIPPFSRHPSVTVRKHDGFVPTCDHYDRTGFWRFEEREAILAAVADRQNVLVSGGSGSGKTTLVRFLLSQVDPSERVVTVEDTFELDAGHVHAHTVALETRPPNKDGRFAIDLSAAVRHVLHMRPDRIVLGEVRGPEALPLLLALGSGHDGAFATIHAAGPEDALRRLAFLAHLAAPSVPLPFLVEEVRRSVHLVVHLERRRDGRRVVSRLWRP
jgi:pilus assembly protein CpaF